MKLKTLLFVLLSVATMGVSAQKFKPEPPTFLKGESQINLVFDYSQVKFNGTSQEDFYKKKDAKWIKEWEGKRRDSNTHAFLTYSSKWMNKINVDLDNHPDAKYTVIVKVDDCFFGAFAGPRSVPAKLQCTIDVVKTGTTDPLATVSLKVSQTGFGSPNEFDRVYFAFVELGTEVTGLLLDALK